MVKKWEDRKLCFSVKLPKNSLYHVYLISAANTTWDIINLRWRISPMHETWMLLHVLQHFTRCFDHRPATMRMEINRSWSSSMRLLPTPEKCLSLAEKPKLSQVWLCCGISHTSCLIIFVMESWFQYISIYDTIHTYIYNIIYYIYPTTMIPEHESICFCSFACCKGSLPLLPCNTSYPPKKIVAMCSPVPSQVPAPRGHPQSLGCSPQSSRVARGHAPSWIQLLDISRKKSRYSQVLKPIIQNKSVFWGLFHGF